MSSVKYCVCGLAFIAAVVAAFQVGKRSGGREATLNAGGGPSVEVLEYNGEGYKRIKDNGDWTVAVINYAARFDPVNFVRMERHLRTDEVFVPIAGESTLVLDGKRIPMEIGKAYDVKAGVWHHIFVSRDARVLVAENSDTGPDNTEYRPVK